MKKTERYLYTVNYPTFEENLCRMEMTTIFGREPEEKVILSNICFPPSHSPFIKKRLDIIYEADSFEEILMSLERDEIRLEEFKVEYIKLERGNIPHQERLNGCREVGLRIIGFPSMRNPAITLGITRHKGRWMLGVCVKNDFKWQNHKNKPCSYSNSLDIKSARAIVNIAAQGDKEKTIIDPCCGVGTTLVEGESMGYDIEGWEINKKIAEDARTNLLHYNLEPRITQGDMHNISKFYDASIVDIPYGLFSHTSEELQQEIINTARRISRRMVLVTFEDLDEKIARAGFNIVERSTVNKGTFTRYILVCE